MNPEDENNFHIKNLRGHEIGMDDGELIIDNLMFEADLENGSLDHDLVREIWKLRRKLSDVVEGWERLPEGNHTPKVVGDWLIKYMKPVIDAARLTLGRNL
jgi:hypothetical protein